MSDNRKSNKNNIYKIIKKIQKMFNELCLEAIAMNCETLEARTRVYLSVIESAYEMRIINSKEVAKRIAEKTSDEGKIFIICSALNSWVGVKNLKGDARIPMEVVNEIAGKVLKR